MCLRLLMGVTTAQRGLSPHTQFNSHDEKHEAAGPVVPPSMHVGSELVSLTSEAAQAGVNGKPTEMGQ